MNTSLILILAVLGILLINLFAWSMGRGARGLKLGRFIVTKKDLQAPYERESAQLDELHQRIQELQKHAPEKRE